MSKPIRLQLSRRKGFNLDALSRAFNGLECVKVARPGPWGNPFTVTDKVSAGKKVGGRYIAVPTVEDAVACYREFLNQRPELIERARTQLRGKNLACWCKPGAPCHADVLLEIANG